LKKGLGKNIKELKREKLGVEEQTRFAQRWFREKRKK